MERIPASERTREKLKAVIEGSGDGGTSELVRLAARLIIEEALEGELSDRKRAILPVVAAIGGMAIPALSYLTATCNTAGAASGWAIPSATDIAFSLGVMALLGSRVPSSLKLFLTALAIIDDLGSILIGEVLSLLEKGLGCSFA